MGTTSQKIQYLGETKDLLKDSINSLGGEITSQTTFRQYATELDSIYSKLPKVSGTGSILSLSPTLKGRLSSVINGDTEQDGEPTPDNPQEIKSVTGLQKVSVVGKNLFNGTIYKKNYVINSNGAESYNASFNLYKISLKPNTTYTIQFKSTDSSTRSSRYIAYKNDGTFISMITEFTYNAGESVTQTFTTPNETSYILYHIGKLVENIMLEQNNQTTDYEPYQTPQEYEINLGKNLLPYDLAKLKSINSGGTWEGDVYTLFGVTYTYNEDGSLTLGGNATGLSYINLYSSNTKSLIDENTTYTYSKGITNINIPIAIYEYINNSWVSKKYVTTPSTTYIPSGEQTGQIIRLLINNETDLSTPITVFPMIVKGTETTSYSPYFTPIHLYENDQIIGTPNNWSIKHVMEKYILDNTKNWYIQSTNNYQVSLGGNDRINLKQSAIGLSNYFRVSSSGNDIFMYPILQGSTDYIRIVNAINKWETIEDFKTFISNNNVELVYELAEPTTEPITNTELIEDLNNFYNKAKSYNGQTNISVEGDLPMILSVSALKGDTQ